MVANFSEFSWFLWHVGWDYQRSCCLAIKKILFYLKSCSIFLFFPLLFYILSQILSLCPFGIQSVQEASETNHIPSFPSHSQPGWQANAQFFWCKVSRVAVQAVRRRMECSFSRPTVPIQHTRKDTSNPVWAFNESWTLGQQRPPKRSTRSLCLNLLNIQASKYK